MFRSDWTFLSNHCHALVCLAADPEVRVREVASRIGVTERCAQQIVSDLEASGVIQRTRTGRRNTYVVRRHARFRHPLESDLTVGEFLDLIGRARSRDDDISSITSSQSTPSRPDDTGTMAAPDPTQWQPVSTGLRERSRSAGERLAEEGHRHVPDASRSALTWP